MMGKPRIALQLYTVRDQLEQDFEGTLKKVRDIGYTHVEWAGFHSRSAADAKKAMDKAGLQATSAHCPLERLESDLDAAIEEAKVLEIKYLVVPYLADERRATEADWLACARAMDKAGEGCRSKGIQLCYHNHSFEFVTLGQRNALDLIYDETGKDNLHAELDTYWVKHGGSEPLDYINRLQGRCPIIHLKDMADDEARSFAAVGTGILDFPAIFAAGEQAGAVWAIVEQDVCPGDPFDAIATSLENLRKMNLAQG